MQSSRFHAIASRFSPTTLRTSFRRSYSSSSRASSNRDSIASSTASSPVSTINSVMFRQPSILDLEEERRTFPGGLSVLEPRPIVYWAGVEERMATF